MTKANASTATLDAPISTAAIEVQSETSRACAAIGPVHQVFISRPPQMRPGGWREAAFRLGRVFHASIMSVVLQAAYKSNGHLVPSETRMP